VNLSVEVPTENIGDDKLSSVWARVEKPDGSVEIVSLAGNANGGAWKGQFANTSLLGTYNITYYANLSSGFAENTNPSVQIFVKELNISTASFVAVYENEVGQIEGYVYREPGHEVSAGASVNASAELGSVTQAMTDANGKFVLNFTPPAVNNITYYNITINATDSEGIYSPVYTIQVKVYPAPTKLNATIYSERNYLNPIESFAIGVVLRNSNGEIISEAKLRAKVYDEANNLVSYAEFSEREEVFEGSYVATLTAPSKQGNYTIKIATEADSYVRELNQSFEFEVNNFTSDLLIYNASRTVEVRNFWHEEQMHMKIETAGTAPLQCKHL
jgi:flagellar hook assembly protein FlgD